MGTFLKALPDDVKRFSTAVDGGHISRFCLVVQDINGDVYADSSPDMRNWILEKSGLAQTIADNDSGKFRNMSNDKARMLDLQGKYPTCASALTPFNATQLRSLVRALGWRTVSHSLGKNKWPTHLQQFRDKSDLFVKSLGVDTRTQQDDGTADDEEAGDVAIKESKRERDGRGRFQQQPMEFEDIFSMKLWRIPGSTASSSTSTVSGTQPPRDNITMKELLQKSPNLMTAAQCVAALGLLMEYYNPGQFSCHALHEPTFWASVVLSCMSVGNMCSSVMSCASAMHMELSSAILGCVHGLVHVIYLHTYAYGYTCTHVCIYKQTG